MDANKFKHLPPAIFRARSVHSGTKRLHRIALFVLPALVVVLSATLYSAGAPEPSARLESTPSNLSPWMAAYAADNKNKDEKSVAITEDELKQMLVGKQLFLRGAYLGDSLSFNEHGKPVGHPTQGSFALGAIEIDKVRLTKHKVELIGARYGLHFLGALPYEDPSNAVDRVKVTPKKKVLKITIDREQVIKPKKTKEPKEAKVKGAKAPQTAVNPVPSSETDVVTAAQPSTSTSAAATPETNASAAPPAKPDSASAPTDSQEPAAAEEAKEEQAADPNSQTTTTSPAHAAQMLRDALSQVFASNLDDDVKSRMPEFWQLYYKAQAAGVDYRPSDKSVMRSSAVDQQAKLTSTIAPESNEFAQADGIAGPALYRVVIGTDGKPGEIAVERPIGFGLDENAVAAIRKATFTPAQKAGQPVAETLDLAVLFRIYSKRTSTAATGEVKTAEPVRPGPYTVREQH